MSLPKNTDFEAGEKEPAQYVEYIEEDDDNSTIEKLETRSSDLSEEEDKQQKEPPSTAKDLVAQVLALEDDPSLNPWTFRMWFLGICLGIFASSMTTISTFRPQPVMIHAVFVVVLSYVFGRIMHQFLPSKGLIGRILNPGPFNRKEHAAICIMTAAASSTPEAMSVLAVQKLWYNIQPNAVVGIFLILSTQMVGYGVAGMLRSTLVYPSKMFYPSNLPTASLIENLHKDRKTTRKRMRVFWIAFIVLFCWQVFPQYIAPVLAGVSIFCLTHQHSLVVTTLFGGSMANEGLGFLSLSFDWTMITSGGNPMYMPFQTLMNSLAGYLMSIGIFMGLYYSDYWKARSFPFLSPQMFSEESSSTKYVSYNQTAILDNNFKVDTAKLDQFGLPYLTSSHAFGMIVRNIGIMASVGHMALWHWDDIKTAFQLFSWESLKKLGNPKSINWKFWQHRGRKLTQEEADEICPHYGLMQAYDEVPSSWFALVWVISAALGLICSVMAGSNLPWWSFFLALVISAACLPFFGALTAMFGFVLNVEPLIQMIGAYLLPGMPVANMYFGMFGYNSLHQAKNMLKDLKLGQYVHLAPRCVFAVQIFGTMLGCLVSYIMMEKITDEKRHILLSIQGTNIWSGQSLQSKNSASIGWGGLAKYMYGAGARYQWVSLSFVIGLFAPLPFWMVHKLAPKLRIDYWNTAIITSAMANLEHGTHSALLFHYATGFFSQLYLRKYRTKWFIKYNYILSAGMDGGAAVIGFILVFAVFGAAGKVVKFPAWVGNNWQSGGNYDFCMRDPALGGHHKGD